MNNIEYENHKNEDGSFYQTMKESTDDKLCEILGRALAETQIRIIESYMSSLPPYTMIESFHNPVETEESEELKKDYLIRYGSNKEAKE